MPIRAPLAPLFLILTACLFGNVVSGPLAADSPPMPLVLRGESLPEVVALQNRLYKIMQRQARYILTLVHPWDKDPRFALMTESRSGEHWIRPNTGMIEGLAFLCRFGPHDEKTLGRSRKELFDKTLVPMMGYCVATHCTGDRVTDDGRPWGDAWQSAHWAQMLGLGAWYTWDDLPDELRAGVRRVVAHEADRIAGQTPPHRLRRDTKAEENAWNSQILSVAVLLMPDDARRPGWEQAFQKWALSAFLRPADEHSSTRVDGRTVAEQYTGANVLDDFTLENHGFVHPDYMSSFTLTLGCARHYDLSDRAAPESLLYNVADIYENLKWFALPDGGLAYPNGEDWELFSIPSWIYVHALMATCGADPDAWGLANRSTQTLEKMQRRHASGMTYGPDETFFPSARTDLFSELGRTWLLLRQAKVLANRPQPRLGVRRLDSAKIVLHRTPNSFNSFSWGARIMAQCVPMRPDRVVSPELRSGIGHVCVAGQDGPVGVGLDTIDVRTDRDGFVATAALFHGDHLVRAELRVESRPDGALRLDERLVALADVTTTEIATGLIGVLNNPHWIYERGQRRLVLDGKEIVVPAHSGKTFESPGTRHVVVDGALRIRSEEPLNVYYAAAREAERGRATDLLYLNHVAGERAWRKGEVISRYRVEIRPVLPEREPVEAAWR